VAIYDFLVWFIVGGVVLGITAAAVIIFAQSRKAKRLEVAPEPAGEVAAAPTADDAKAVAQPLETTSDQVPAADVPEPPASRLTRLRRRLAAAENPFARGLLALLATDRISAETWDDLETSLITADLGVGPTTELIDALRAKMGVEGESDPAKAKAVLREELVKLVDPGLDRELKVAGAPGVVLVVGVNGTGKTTTIGKLARVLVAEGHSVLLGAADTFRAAAADQLETWGSRVGVPVVRGPEGGDPASVAFDAVDRGIADGVDVVVVDTAGRLHTKAGLMDELGKIKRVIERKAPVSEVLLVIDATTGQNGLTQARVFAEVVDVTGVVLTKLDGSAKGGIVVQVQRELGVPVKLIGLGEGADDLAPFDAAGFVDALLDA
jgi:fused signal recognition particle receptor